MTPYERVDQRMKGMSWDEAEEVGIEIIARVMALHVYARKEEDYIPDLMKRICHRAYEWAHESDENIFRLAMAALAHERKQDTAKTFNINENRTGN